ncbi:cyclic di-AMP synthase CdaA [Halolactibacillus alkaliphilus]|uniref:Diadenylate cyclase n=1 Tax=Halolactibacillus alkaliphilus TaxID=442899 RepID=A0A511X4A4_9BACI|nr:diadenylate cyclase CdaA [Halolactibacillus alkaliphilus]GEN57777.1 cyclic di-AMP synthase CdaA [Halolactibacillus alkaliphilus]GGN75016.1 cyclic di-AMP synthase CdaA [Halolactibacillus alkaliphilus]SFP04755.1 diadenylate cyclase [Halolactibacillus alkaliphilus]
MLGEGFSLFNLLRFTVDIALVWYVFYKLIMLLRGTKAIQLLKGIFVVFIIYLISYFLNLQTVQVMIEQIIVWGPLAVIILFQPELRRALEQIGRGSFFSRNRRSEEEIFRESLDAIIKSVNYMAKRRIGALITIEKETNMGDFIQTGIPINGQLTHQLLTNIFVPNTPLHDGAVIMKGNQIIAAACYLPLSESPFISKELGTRHRAAMGISEVSDAITIIVSEETGHVSLAKNGELYRSVDEKRLIDLLSKELAPELAKISTFKQWSWRGKKK